MRLEIAKEKITPYILVDSEEGVIKLIGRSSPKNTIEFYSPLIDALDDDSLLSKDITVHFNLEYFNTSTAKCMFMVFKKLSRLNKNGSEVSVNWYSEEDDYDLIETGEDFEDLTGMDFNYIML